MSKKNKASSVREPIAIIGMGCRFPGAANRPEAFWDLLKSGADAMVDVPPERWDWRRFYDPNPDKPGKMYIRQAGFLQEPIDRFDTQFFGISPREATRLDPQQRLLLEVTWEALEDAGLPIESVQGSDTGVYVGGFNLDNTLTQLGILNRHWINAHTPTSGSMTLLANRISHVFDFRGPSVSMDTACSASLVALHYACQGLWQGECGLAIVGGANVISRPEFSIVMSKGKYLSPSGRCKTFDASADGYGRGEGAGVVILKRLEQALVDCDPIYALVRGTGVNQDGHTAGIMLPSGVSQETLLRQVYRQTEIEPHQIQYVEAHGTGTQAGDIAEATAIGTVIGEGRSVDHSCIIGSVKTNIGHLEAAAGIAGVIKTVLSLQHRAIPPNLHFETPNPAIPFDALRLHVPQTLEPWPECEGPRLAGVNSFGYGGTNAHVVLEAFEPDERRESLRPPVLIDRQAAETVTLNREDKNGDEVQRTEGAEKTTVLPLSARDKEALQAIAGSYIDFLSGSDISLQDLYHSLTARRSHHPHRLAVVTGSPANMRDQLQQFVAEEPPTTLLTGRTTTQEDHKLVFVYTGMGPQWWAMGHELLETESVFREAVTQCDRLFQEQFGWSLLDVWLVDEAQSRMDQPEVAQPANFALQIGLTELWRSWGLKPDAVVGHSVGEVAAAYAAGVLNLEQAIQVCYHRSRLQQTINGQGRMLATGLSEDQAQELLAELEGLISIASINSRSSVVLSGDPVALEEIAGFLDQENIFQRFLHVQVAYHSYQMEPLQTELLESFQGLTPQPPRLPLYSTVTGRRVTDVACDAAYWWGNVRQPVRLAEALGKLIADDYHTFIEVGPHPVLGAYIREELMAGQAEGQIFASLHRQKSERSALLEAVGGLYCKGYPVDWERLSPGPGGYVKLPSYPWQRDSYFFESEASREDRLGSTEHPLLGNRLRIAGHVWETEINDLYFPYLKDHLIEDALVFPGAAYVEIGLALDRVMSGERSTVLEELVFHRALILDLQVNHVLQTEMDDKDQTFTIASTTEGERTSWTVHATGRLLQGDMGAPPEPLDLDAIRRRCVEPLDIDAQYQELHDRGHRYGADFRCVQQIWRGTDEILAEIKGYDDADASYRLHPVVLDAAFQALIAVFDRRKASDVYMPVEIEQVQFHQPPGPTFWAYGRTTSETADVVIGDVVLCDDAGQIYAYIKGLRCQALPMTRKASAERIDQWLYAFQWDATDLAALIGDAGISASRIDWATSGAWLVFVNTDDAGETVLEALETSGVPCIRVEQGDSFQEIAPDRYQIRADQAEDVQRLIEVVGVERLRGAVYLWSLTRSVETSDWKCSSQDCLTVTYLVQSLAERTGTFRLGLVTRQAQAVNGGESVNVMTSPLWGLGRVIMNEHPELDCCIVDLDDQTPNHDQWMALLVGGHAEEEIAFRHGAPFVHRLVRARMNTLSELHSTGNGVSYTEDITPIDLPEHLQGDNGVPTNGHGQVVPVELEIGQPGVIDSLRFRTIRRRTPGSGEVEIHVHTVALNFKDVMKVMGLLSDTVLEGTFFGDTLGMECSGTIVSVGSEAGDFQVGDEVIVATGEGCFRSHLTVAVNEAFIVRKPATMTMAEAPILIPYLTVYYSLHDVARLEAGERILIHAGTGGVGLAAIHYAQTVGAEIFATAGSPEKRDYLKSLGVRYVMDSRSLKFADDVMSWTDGRGVDVVLNSLFGEALTKSFEILAPFGRFIEIGKRDIDENNALRMRPFNRNIMFAAIDLDRLVVERRDLAARLFRIVYQGWQDGTFKPLPTRTFPASDVAGAFRYMGQAKHIGKVTVSMQDRMVDVAPLPPKGPAISADGTYLITGGLGGFGLATAQWLVDQGARHLALAGRSGAASAEAQTTVTVMEEAGVNIHVARVDVADSDQVDRLIEDIRTTMPPLKGVIHAAGILADGRLTQLDETAFDQVLAPKIAGAWHLHRATRTLPLDYFILFSSVATLMGNVGQGNYAAANAFLDGLAHYRRAQGLPATSVNWGVLKDVGMAAREPAVLEFLERMGLRGFTPAQALEGLNRVLGQNPVQIGIMDLDWSQWGQTQWALARSPRFHHLVSAVNNGHEDDRVSRLLRMLSRMDEGARMLVLQNLVAGQVARALRLPLDKLDVHQPLMDMGMDSLTGFELLTVIQSVLGVEISPMELMRGVSVVQLSRSLHDKLAPQEAVPPEDETDSADELDALLESMIPANTG